MTNESDRPVATSFVDQNLSGARFTQVMLVDAVMRGVVVNGMEIDSPWLCEGGASLVVNGVDVAPLVDAELNRRFPGRELRQSPTLDGLGAGWAALERTWEATLQRVAAMPDGTVDISVDGEWSFADTLRHLVMATDTWLGKAVLEIEQPYHPVGMPDTSYESDGGDMAVFHAEHPTYAEVLDARADRVKMVRDYLADASPSDLDEPRKNPHDPTQPEKVWSCLNTILEEEWEHHRYAVRDLDTVAGREESPQGRP